MQAVDERVPGDVSAAAFWLVAGSIHPDAELTLRDVGVNPTRRAIIDLLRRMGADIDERPTGRQVERGGAGSDDGVGEPMADLRRPVGRRSAAIEIGPDEVATAIDEIPVLCLAAAFAEGTTRISGAGELRNKESDRIAGIAAGLERARRDRSRSTATTSTIHGGRPLAGAATDSLDDHRLAMTFAMAGLVASGETVVGRPASAAISYPGFFADLEGVRA